MKKFWFLIITIYATSALQAQKKPNIVIILADDMGYGDIGCYGNKQIKTPNLDQMAKNGVRFIDFHSNGPVCSPTRAALLTGKYQQRTGITDVITAKSDREKGLLLSETTFAEALKTEGYATGIFGKWHLGYAERFNPIHQGFDEFKGYLSGNVDYQSHIDQEGYVDWWEANQLKSESGYSTDLITRNANNFIERHQAGPFLLYIAEEAPHSPFQIRSSKADRSPGGKADVDFPVSGSEKDYSHIYKIMIEILDESVGKTMKTLKRLGLYDNTVVIFCSDNGAIKRGSNGLLRGFKGDVWEGGHRVPAIVQWPSHIKAGWQSKETVLTMDIFPTLLDLAAGKVPDGIDGVSIAKHLLYQKPLASRTVFFQYKDKYAARKGKWKVVIAGANVKPVLYDMDVDPGEKKEMSRFYPDILNELLGELETWKLNVAQNSTY